MASRTDDAADPGDAPGAAPGRHALIRTTLPVDLRLTLGPLRRMGGLSWRTGADGSWWRAARTPDGPVTASMTATREGILVRAWGPGAGWALEAAPDLLGARDSLDGFDPAPGLVRDLHRRMPGLRVTRSRAVFEAIVPTILAQRVTGLEAGRAWKRLLRTVGDPAPWPAPGPAPLRVPPAPATLAAMPYHAYHPFGVEMRRANVIRAAAREAAGGRLEPLADLPPRDASRRLRALPGVGAWTAAEVAVVAFGDADAVSVGDFHIPDTVSWALAGEPRGTDERMLQLLEPYAGHRGRVIRLLEAAGIQAPRFGPKTTVRSIRRL